MNTDQKILQGLKNGDITAFKTLINEYSEDMVILAYSIIGDPVKANDIVSDVLYRLWKDGREKEIETPLSTYLYKQVKFECVKKNPEIEAR